ncbi:hypothetical protein ACJJTC_004966 [Scirpophaga incertulas]
MNTNTKETMENDVTLRKCLNKIAKREGFEDFNITTKDIVPDGNNYLAVLKEVTITSTNNSEHEKLELFVKLKDPNVAVEALSLSKIYNRELFTCINLSKIFEELQQEANIPSVERYKFIKYYEESNTDYIIMDNMKKKGFTIHDRLEIISLEYAELCIKQLAKFHALSYALKNKRPHYYDNVISTLKHAYEFTESWTIFVNKMYRTNLELLEDSARMKYENAIPSLVSKFILYTENSDSIKCLCHGDFRTSNILQRVEDDAVVEVIPIDYQLIYIGSPILDLLYFIFGATDREFRRKHLEDLKNLYFNSVKQFLKFFSIDIEEVCPRTEFERIFKERLDFGLAVSLFFIPLNLIEDDEYPDFSNLSEVNIKNKSDRVITRIRGVTQEFIEWGYL